MARSGNAAATAVALLVGVLMLAAASPAVAETHHVVGGDVGWDPSTDVALWSADKIFRVGDQIWFAYSAARESIVELRTKEEYESCDLTNPIKMFTDGIDGVPLEGEGIRYFASSRAESCKGGMRLHVEVQPRGKEAPAATTSQQQQQIATSEAAGLVAAATAPTAPSGSHRSSGLPSLLVSSLFLGVGLFYWAL